MNQLNERGDEKTSERILRKAEEILANEGYDGLSMRKIAARVGISQAAIYRHYSDKAQLVARIVAAGYGRLVAMAERVFAAQGSAEDKLRSAIRGYIELSLERPELFKAVMLRDIGPAQKGAEVLAEGVSSGRRTFALLAQTLAAGMEAGTFRRADPEITAQAVWAAMYGLAARLILERVPPGPRRVALVDGLAEIVAAGLRGEGKVNETR